MKLRAKSIKMKKNIYQNIPSGPKVMDSFILLHCFASVRLLSKKTHIWQVHWLDLVNIYQYANIIRIYKAV